MRQMRNRTMKSADLATLRSLHGRKRWEHIWAYYKLPILGILIVLYIFGYAAYRHFTKKEAVLYVSLVNISAGSDLTGQLTDGFAQYAHLTKKQQVNLLTGLIINETANADEQYVYASELKLLAAVSAQQLDVILMDTAAREQLQGEEYFLVDAGGGNGILSQLDKASIPLEKIHHIFVTHAHNDHILGMVWMIRMIATSMNKGTYDGTLTIYCHEELVDTIKTLTKLTVGKKFYKHFDERILFHVVAHSDTVTILEDSFTFFDIGSTKEKQFGFTCLMDHGTKVSFPGDEPYRESLYEFVKGSDWLLHEAFCVYDERDIFKPYEKHHSTVKDACELAQTLHIPNLVLWHTEDKDMKHRQGKYLAEGKQYYDGKLYIPEDFDVLKF